MKKLFTSLFLLTLIVSLLCSAPVMADEVLSFVYTQVGYDPGSETKKYCNGNDADNLKWIADGDFNWNQTTDNVAQQEVSSVKWTGVDQAQACTRSDVSFSAANYTLTLLTYRTNHTATMTLPSISINGGDFIYASEARWGVSSTETIVNNQFNYTNDNGKGAFQTEVRLIYHTKIDVANSYGISVSFPSGYDRFKDYVKTLTISQDAPTYAVSVNATNGTVSGTGSYAEGATVTLTPSADPDYSFSGWSSVSGVDLTGHLNDNPLIFTMPGNAVSLTANFTACTKHTVTLTAGANGSVSGGGVFCDGSVTVTATPNSGYRFVNWTNTSTSEVVSTDAEYTFTLSADISLTANFEVDLCSSSLTLEVEDSYAASSDYSEVNYPSSMAFVDRDPSGSGYVSSCHGRGYVNYNGGGGDELIIPIDIPVSGTYKVKAYAGVRKDMFINIYAKTVSGSGSITYNGESYYKQTYKKINDGNNDETFVESEYTDPVSLPSGVCLVGLYGSWSHSAWDQITITRTDGTAFCPNTITMQKSGDASAADPTSSPASAAMAGTVVTVTAGAPSDASHYFVNWTASPSVEFVNANASSTTFVMPAEDVTITANYGAIVSSALTFAAGEGGAVVSATAGGDPISSGDEVISGTSVTLTAEANSNYVFINWTDDNNSDAVVSTNAAFTFSMPAASTAYTAHFAQIDNVISQGSETGSSTYHDGASMEESHLDDFGTFGHVVLMLSYSDMTGGNYHGWNIGKNSLYNSANSAGATGFGFYYKTETDEDKVAFCFDHGDQYNQYKVELPATNNVWKYHYFDKSAADGWNGSNIVIFINGTDGDNTTANANGAIYLADIAATSITSKPDIDTYIYTRDISGAGWGTLCLPMDGAVEGATLFSVAGKQEENSKLYVVLQEEPDLVGGQPYIFEKTADELRATMSGPQTPSPATVNGLVGTYVEISPLTPYDESHKNYILAKNGDDVEFRKVGDNVTVGEYRAYINLDGVPAYSPSQAIPGRRYVMMGVSGTQETEDTEDISAVEEVESGKVLSGKILVNGQLYLMYEGKMYDVQGARVK